MSVEDWLQAFGDPVGAEALEVPGAKALASFVGTYGAHIAGVSELYRKSEWELIVLDFRTGRPQDSAYSIRRVERVGVLFRHTESMPLIFMLRDDFPDTEHQQLAIEGMPRAICIDDRNWLEARLTWTPAELIQRILSWFKRAAEGRLHDARQPLDPVFFGSPLSFIVSRAVLDGSDGHRLVGVHDDTHRSTIRVRRTRDGAAPGHALEPFFMTAYRVAPEHMRRLQFAPDNLASLAAMLEERGIKLLENLAEEFSGLFGQGNGWAITPASPSSLICRLSARRGSSRREPIFGRLCTIDPSARLLSLSASLWSSGMQMKVVKLVT
ncbi:hypothetical protein AUC70_05895 [Methyloceanibacter stevinii]|uniref:Uncharacterized protein n=1 Tax=Methyloceanibacter stevinii TaxID=1774970 RepID=A0A1E3VNX4_9HYPH|nr:hypothetical protein [Methyloceanibacter stevinii]ODR95227.1 hypothetical protein AUC70_05895 [Methyloceanibacter stevinii]